ncbi:hypothetical protein HELRODRAFT_188683, partial [Helobdella robusta]|uniref:RRM domain-containing protein n=1 Tax=Helobdella robusta TaxID=6412 RepID=T1FQ91_HELRO
MLMGVEQPLPSTIPSKMKNSNKIVVKNLPTNITKDDAQSLINNYGNVKSYALKKLANNSSLQCLEVTFESHSAALKAYEGLQNFTFRGSSLHVEFAGMNNGTSVNNNSAVKLGKTQSKSSTTAFNSKFNNLPLRVLIPTQFVGAIIGKKGLNIKNITTKCKARIDVHGKENIGYTEKMISIYGQQENRTAACKEILKVLVQENMFGTKGASDIVLKMLANDQYCGRLIGKEGRSIKKIKQDTSTKIVVTNIQDVSGMYPDRIISIRGSVDGVSAAEAALSSKLVQCMENDSLKMNGLPNNMSLLTAKSLHGMPHALMQHGRNNVVNQMMMPMGTSLPNALYPTGGVSSNNLPHYGFGDGGLGYMLPPVEMCQVCIPNAAVGALIGTGGANIKQMMRECGAYIS